MARPDLAQGGTEGAVTTFDEALLSSPEFEQRIGWVTPLDTPMVLVVEDAASAQHAMHALAFLGLDRRVTGYPAGSMKAWIDAGYPMVDAQDQTVRDPKPPTPEWLEQ